MFESKCSKQMIGFFSSLADLVLEETQNLLLTFFEF